MTDVRVLKGANIIDPNAPSAVGSRNSLNRDGRDEYLESKVMVDDEVDKILNHVSTKLPAEALGKADVMAGVKSKLYNYYNLNYQNMLNRYLVTVEDEMGKKYRDMIDKEEYKQLNHYTPRFMSDLLSTIGKEDMFTTRGFEESFASTYQQLQKNIDHGIQNLTRETKVLLDERTGAGAFVHQGDASKLVQFSFKNNPLKPQTVVDVKVGVNVLDDELIDPIFHYQKPISSLLKEVISNHIHEKIDTQILNLEQDLSEKGEEALSEEKILMKRFELLEDSIGFNGDLNDENNKRYDFVAKKLMDAVEGDTFELPAQEMEEGTIRANVKSVLDQAHVRDKGFNNAVNMLTTILDDSKIGYQFIDNLKNARTCVIKEYQDTNPNDLPDETFGIRLTYLDWDQLRAKRDAYEKQATELETEVNKAVLVVEKLFKAFCTEKNIKTYQNIADEFIRQDGNLEGETRSWNELVFTDVSRKLEKVQTFKDFQLGVKRKLNWMQSKLQEVYRQEHPQERLIIENRIEFLSAQYAKLTSEVNPFHLQQGLLVQLSITSVKKKAETLKAMSLVVNELLYNISKNTDAVVTTAHKKSVVA